MREIPRGALDHFAGSENPCVDDLGASDSGKKLVVFFKYESDCIHVLDSLLLKVVTCLRLMRKTFAAPAMARKFVCTCCY